jgi:hypothetical protein
LSGWETEEEVGKVAYEAYQENWMRAHKILYDIYRIRRDIPDTLRQVDLSDSAVAELESATETLHQLLARKEDAEQEARLEAEQTLRKAEQAQPTATPRE